MNPRGHIRRITSLAAAAALALAAGACTPARSHPAAPSRSSSGPSALPAPGTSARPTPGTSAQAATGTPSTAAGRPAGVVTVAFAGDVHFMDQIGRRLAADPATVFGQAAPVLRRADLTMVNLETAITTGGTAQAKEFTFRAPPAALTALRDAGVDVATMANNHGADYGASGLRDSLAAIRATHFPVIGIGADADAAFAPYRTTINGVRLAIFAADQVQDETTLRLFSAGPHTAGVANAYRPRLIAAVRRAREQGYTVVVYLHWGIEYQSCPSADQRQLADRLAAAGASAIVGSHAHVLQGAGWRGDGSYVAYGLGNYLWWRTFGNDQDDNGVLTLTFDHSRVTAARFAPAHLDSRGVPVPAAGAEKRRIDAEWNSVRQCADLSSTPPR